MKKERETVSNVKLSARGGVPTVSFGATGDAGVRLVPEEYKISGNEFTAWYDGAHKLVFVLDNTLDSRKPNVLLVINPIGDRKWDDILANDFGVDLETIRPKVDNKYQKLDIEYSGLSIYNKLINAHNNDESLDIPLAELSNFRTMTVRRAAADRLATAEDTIEKTRETISKTGETMRELQSHQKKLREKLSRQKKQVGKEPTKQSAAKILKTESQIDATAEKQKRAKKRLASAQRRLTTAEEDAKIARRILGQKENLIEIPTSETEIIEEPKAPQMAEEVKPLFDKDPEILDEKIAFKPIDFGAPVTPITEPVFSNKPEPSFVSEDIFKPVQEVQPAAPLSFTPPTATESVREEIKIVETPVVPVEPVPAPVLETITTVSEPTAIPEPIPAPQPVDEVRPVSPITGVAVPVDGGERKRPNALYYIMLVILIVLSVFTLWFYQKKTATDTTPDLAQTTAPEAVTPAPAPAIVESPFIIEPVVKPELVVIAEQPVVVEVPAVQPEPAAPVILEVEPAPVILEIEPEPAPVAQPEPGPFLVPEPTYSAPVPIAPAPVAKPAVVNKPAYDVSTDKTFSADRNYNNPDQQASGGYYADDRGVIQKSDTYESYEKYDYSSEDDVACADGTAPDQNGCCAGENFDGARCCTIEIGADGMPLCYPPMR